MLVPLMVCETLLVHREDEMKDELMDEMKVPLMVLKLDELLDER